MAAKYVRIQKNTLDISSAEQIIKAYCDSGVVCGVEKVPTSRNTFRLELASKVNTQGFCKRLEDKGFKTQGVSINKKDGSKNVVARKELRSKEGKNNRSLLKNDAPFSTVRVTMPKNVIYVCGPVRVPIPPVDPPPFGDKPVKRALKITTRKLGEKNDGGRNYGKCTNDS